MPVQIPPECQALLEDFEEKAQAATDANDQAQADRAAATQAEQVADNSEWQAGQARQEALDAAQAFVECLVPQKPEQPTAKPK